MVPLAFQPALFAGALLLGGLVAALTGLAVGVPSLRLRGDYLAIVTLGPRLARQVYPEIDALNDA